MSNHPSGLPSRETRKTGEIKFVKYGDKFGDTVRWCDPSDEDVQRALDEGQLEERDYQADVEELKSEWYSASKGGRDSDEWVRQVKGYHARRVAFFVENGWDDPITITSDGQIRDGSHRLRAAIFKGRGEVDVVVTP